MDNKEIALGLTQVLAETINASCSANDTVKNNSIVVVGYYEAILEMLDEHSKRDSK